MCLCGDNGVGERGLGEIGVDDKVVEGERMRSSCKADVEPVFE